MISFWNSHLTAAGIDGISTIDFTIFYEDEPTKTFLFKVKPDVGMELLNNFRKTRDITLIEKAASNADAKIE